MTGATGADRVLAYLAARGVQARLHRHAEQTPTVETAARVLGVPVDAIVKTRVYIDEEGRAVLAIARGTGRVDRKKVAALAGARKLRLASAADVLAATGYEAGAVPPVAHEPAPRAVVMDDDVLAAEVVYGGGGDVDAMLEIAPAAIREVTGAVLGSLRAVP